MSGLPPPPQEDGWNCRIARLTLCIQDLILYLQLNGYKKQEVPKKIRSLISKINKSISKYPSSLLLIKRTEELAPGIFAPPEDENWLALLRYVQRKGHACPPTMHEEDGKKIGYYVSNIRQKFKRSLKSGKSFSEKSKFENLPGWKWDAYDRDLSLT